MREIKHGGHSSFVCRRKTGRLAQRKIIGAVLQRQDVADHATGNVITDVLLAVKSENRTLR
jgi:hypothetical protein